YAVRIVAYQVMSNHFHLLLQAPAEPPSEEETIERFEDFHAGKRKLLPGSSLCRTWQGRLRDVSWCLRHLQHLYTAWYNRSRPVRRRGPLWAGRFKNTVLDTGAALWACWTYIERNPVRAGMVADPGDYRFSSYGAWVQTGRHPFAESFQTYLLPALPDPLRNLEPTAIRCALRKAFAALAAADSGGPSSLCTSARSIPVRTSSCALREELGLRHPETKAMRTTARVLMPKSFTIYSFAPLEKLEETGDREIVRQYLAEGAEIVLPGSFVLGGGRDCPHTERTGTMRHPRLKPEYRDTWHHCYNRAVGTSADRPLDDTDQEQPGPVGTTGSRGHRWRRRSPPFAETAANLRSLPAQCTGLPRTRRHGHH
ncbi:MAG: hypothetical protein PHR35_06785, partial [Kiritimatiellae bacterium]|nr:hypothetical protein [Kiritimatiellia bacterium]